MQQSKNCSPRRAKRSIGKRKRQHSDLFPGAAFFYELEKVAAAWKVGHNLEEIGQDISGGIV